MKKFYLILTLLFLTLSVSLFACSERKIESVTLPANSFKSDFVVDERLDLTGTYVVVRYSGGEEEEVEITPDMISGFDTTTTGGKTLSVRYKDFVMDSSYRVFNPENAAKEIVTKARLILYADKGADYIDYTVRLSSGDLTNVAAVDFTLTSTDPLGINDDLSNISAVSDNTYAHYESKLSSDGKKLKTVVFCTDGRAFADGSIVIKLKVNGGENRSVSLKNITVSDGKKDYYLPISE